MHRKYKEKNTNANTILYRCDSWTFEISEDNYQRSYPSCLMSNNSSFQFYFKVEITNNQILWTNAMHHGSIFLINNNSF